MQSLLKWLVIRLIIPLLVRNLRLLIIMVALIVGVVIRLLPLLHILEQVSIRRNWLSSICLLVSWSGRLTLLVWLRVTNEELVTLVVVIKFDRMLTRVTLLGLVLAIKRVIINVCSVADRGLTCSKGLRVPWHHILWKCLFYS